MVDKTPENYNQAYNAFLDLMFYPNQPIDLIEDYVLEDVMGYGTTLDERIFGLDATKDLAALQRNQADTLKFRYENSPVYLKIMDGGRTIIEVDEIEMTMQVEGKEVVLHLRMSTVWKLLKETWKLVHWHGSKPEYDSGGTDTWHTEELIQKSKELEKQVEEKTADLASKNRELEIEASLERVRTVAMGMQKPDDILDVCKIISDQLEKLNISDIRNTQVVIINETKKTYLNYQFFTPYAKKVFEETEYENYPTAKAMASELQKSANSFFTGILEDDALEEFREWRKKYKQFPDPLMDKSSAIHYNFYSIGKGGLGLTTYKNISRQSLAIFKRFHKVFTLAYSRFMDIKKAEAQAREAQIEAAIERVRSRSMAMHKSEELADLSLELVKQVQELGVGTWFCAFNINDEDGKGSMEWGSNGQGTFPKYRTPREGVFLKYHKAAQRGETLLINEIDEKECPAHYDYLCSLPGVGEQLLEMKDAGIPFPTSQIDHVAFFKYGYILFITFEPAPEAHDIFMRFAKVFEQTYTRFLDLKKAEAQAREAEIELALERVRARTMAMQKGEELKEVVVMLYKELIALGLTNFVTCGYVEINEKISRQSTWVTSPGGDSLGLFYLPLTGDAYFDKRYAAWKQQQIIFHQTVAGENRRKHLEYAITTFQSKEAEEMVLGQFPDPCVFYCFNFSHGYLHIVSGSQLEKEEESLMARFTRVFEQTYARFLDLQKAEAQAREAQIEASLERVRGRTLAMQNSEELAETASVVFKQLIDLGISPNRLYIGIVNDDSGDIEFWATEEDGTKISTKFTGNKNFNKSINKMYVNWAHQQKSLTIDMQGTELEEYLNYIGNELRVPFKERHTYKRRIQTIAFFSKGFIGIASPDEQPEETTRLLERFAAGFNLTFTRFSDLKIAEANALKAQQDLIEIKEARKKAEDALVELQATQKQLIQSEKMASLGELTAGIAHEIQNPLNFVNNFSEVSEELVLELKEELDSGDIDEAKIISNDVVQNLKKINHHGHRASSIVKGMLEHSRSDDGKKELVDINLLADEYLRLAYHGLRAKDKLFKADFKLEADEKLPKIKLVPQEIGRVLLNLMNNAFYAVADKTKENSKEYKPSVIVTTKNKGPKIEILVKDNGNGIPDAIKEKIFQPFFTTKPTGLGTGLGLSLSYDIIHAHGGDLQVKTKKGQETAFIITLPA